MSISGLAHRSSTQHFGTAHHCANSACRVGPIRGLTGAKVACWPSWAQAVKTRHPEERRCWPEQNNNRRPLGFQVSAPFWLLARQHIAGQKSPSAIDTQQLLQPTTTGDSSPSALFEAARTSVPLFQALTGGDDERSKNNDSVLVEHIPGFASVGSSVYEVRHCCHVQVRIMGAV